MLEEFKTIKDFDNYLISNFGNVKSVKTNRILKPAIASHGYYNVSIRKDKKTYTKLIHKLVAETFIENPDDKQCVDHIDNNKLNNNIDNLRYATPQENIRNCKLYSTNTSGIKGVHYKKANKKWCAQIYIDGISVHLGLFSNIEDAKNAREIKANEVFGVYINVCEKN